MMYVVWAQMIGSRHVLGLYETEYEAQEAMHEFSRGAKACKPLTIKGRGKVLNPAHIQYLEVAPDTYGNVEKLYGGE